ncbi:hypothetical protein AGR3A_pa10036 [Agrobacterium tomkonis CFBP 6623]|uniref:Uncharacterized protein n=1 Tax=Agrobacterium tomkonis CFBP 6623 TaxID=1183432 RepID=A0A1S7S8C4_9HYPH|nr:hypothetical protein AGR3A_pa10036 [Agrobacterium tomkonis CFBP 6623]CUX65906.1 hypothetical protein AGR5A_pa30056 [Agrobacterium genomosp. 5 str. CFBP 6626]
MRSLEERQILTNDFALVKWLVLL